MYTFSDFFTKLHSHHHNPVLGYYYYLNKIAHIHLQLIPIHSSQSLLGSYQSIFCFHGFTLCSIGNPLFSSSLSQEYFRTPVNRTSQKLSSLKKLEEFYIPLQQSSSFIILRTNNIEFCSVIECAESQFQTIKGKKN